MVLAKQAVRLGGYVMTEKQEKVRQILIEYGNQEYGDLILEAISEVYND